MKKIERPDSTTVLIEIPYHLIKDIQEMKNIFGANPPDTKIVPEYRLVDEKTFQPQVAFRVVHPKLPFESERYIATLELIQDAKIEGIDLSKFEVVDTI